MASALADRSAVTAEITTAKTITSCRMWLAEAINCTASLTRAVIRPSMCLLLFETGSGIDD
jgi:hypothetical protein